MKKTILLAAVVMALNAQATFTWNSGTLNQVVPDNNTNGWANSTVISGQSGTIAPGSLVVTLNLSGGWNGDLYAYLVNSSGGFSMLLNRVGMGEGNNVNSYGYGDAGMNVTLGATGSSIHSYGGNTLYSGVPTGAYLPDGAGFGSFVNPNGTWSLFIADLSGGGVSTVTSWGLQMDIVAVPEVESWVAAAVAGAFGAFWLNRQLWSGVKRSDGKPSHTA